VERWERSMHGRHLRGQGFGPPVLVYFRRDGAIVAGGALLRDSRVEPFDTRTVRLLRQLHPLLEDALSGTAAGAVEPGRDPLLAAGLTVRETEVAELVADGATNADIAGGLGMSEATVKTHLTRVYAKLGLRSRTQLAVALGGGRENPARSRSQPVRISRTS
jgi:DNA-binding CsgD family transcriptional regulator